MALGLIEGHEHGWVSRGVKQRRDEPPEVQYVLHNPKRHHPQRTVSDALLINPPEDLPHLDAVMSHPFLNASGDRLVTAEGLPSRGAGLSPEQASVRTSIDRSGHRGPGRPVLRLPLRQSGGRPDQSLRGDRHANLPPVLRHRPDVQVRQAQVRYRRDPPGWPGEPAHRQQGSRTSHLLPRQDGGVREAGSGHVPRR